MNILLSPDRPSGKLTDKDIKALDLPEKSLITVIKREGEIIFPPGNTTLMAGGELSIIGEKKEIDEIRKAYTN